MCRLATRDDFLAGNLHGYTRLPVVRRTRNAGGGRRNRNGGGGAVSCGHAHRRCVISSGRAMPSASTSAWECHRHARPAAPIGGDIAEVMGDQQRNAEVRILVMQFECHRHLAVTMIYGTCGNALKARAGRAKESGRPLEGRILRRDGATFVDGYRHIAIGLAHGVGDLLGKARGVQSQCRSGPCRFKTMFVISLLPLFYLRAVFRSSPRDFSSLRLKIPARPSSELKNRGLKKLCIHKWLANWRPTGLRFGERNPADLCQRATGKSHGQGSRAMEAPMIGNLCGVEKWYRPI